MHRDVPPFHNLAYLSFYPPLLFLFVYNHEQSLPRGVICAVVAERIIILLLKKKCNAAISRANIVLATSVSPRVKEYKWSTRETAILHSRDKVHEGKQLNDITISVHLLSGWPNFYRPPSHVHCHLMVNLGLQLPRPPGHHSGKG